MNKKPVPPTQSDLDKAIAYYNIKASVKTKIHQVKDAALEIAREGKIVTITELVERTGLARFSVTVACQRLRDKGLLLPVPERPGAFIPAAPK